MRRLVARSASLALLALAANACSDAGPSTTSQVSFNVATQAAPAAVRGSALGVVSTPETFTDGTNTLVISKVELVAREIELHRAGVTADCAPGVSGDCEELELGPVLIDVPLGVAGASSGIADGYPAGRAGRGTWRRRAGSTPAGVRARTTRGGCG